MTDFLRVDLNSPVRITTLIPIAVDVELSENGVICLYGLPAFFQFLTRESLTPICVKAVQKGDAGRPTERRKDGIQVYNQLHFSSKP